jgi:glyoxylase-like metal-dependent hydrolase (beta-lactamase superfamily II)
MRFNLASACVAAVFCISVPASAQQADHLLSRANLSRVAAHTWMIKGFPNVGIVVGKHATLVIDTGMGTKNGEIVSGIALALSPKGQKLYLTTTHYHAEHASGDGGFPPGTVVIRPRVQQAELESEGQKLMDSFSSRSQQDKALLQGVRIKPADILFDKDYRLDLGGVNVRMFWFGAAHTRGDEVTQVEPDNVLFTGDVVQNKTGPNFYCSECTPSSWLAVLGHVAALRPNLIVPDHSDVGGDSLIAQERAFLLDLQSRAMVLKAQGKSADEAGRMVTEEFQAKYQGWSGLGHLAEGVARAYDNPRNP